MATEEFGVEESAETRLDDVVSRLSNVKISTADSNVDRGKRTDGASMGLGVGNIGTEFGGDKEVLDSNALTFPKSPRTIVVFQPTCLLHKYLRSSDPVDISMFPERPERLRAIKTGTAAILARLYDSSSISLPEDKDVRWKDHIVDPMDDISDGLQNLKVSDTGASKKRLILDTNSARPFDILSTSRLISFQDPSLLLIHQGTCDDPDSKNPSSTHVNYPSQLESWCSTAPTTFPTSASKPRPLEIPSYLPMGDLYLARASALALRGSLGALADTNDIVFPTSAAYDKAFVAVRPPGHHCGESNPQGFCWVNNVAFGIVDAHLRHGINRAIIFDIDLHHGNGTQEIVWEINRRYSDSVSPKSTPKKGRVNDSGTKPQLQVFYGSLHDINSYPCESGLDEFVLPASANIMGGPTHQYISNVHLESYKDAEDFHTRLYPMYWQGLGGKARDFLLKTGEADKVGIWISAGFDASEFEMGTMSRHKVKVPTSFYSRFAKDVVELSQSIASAAPLASAASTSLKRSVRRTAAVAPPTSNEPTRPPPIIGVLEGGYSDRALTSGVASLLQGLVWKDVGGGSQEKEEWWAAKEWVKLEKACAPIDEDQEVVKRKGRKREGWLECAKVVLAELEREVPKEEVIDEQALQSKEGETKPSFPVKKIRLVHSVQVQQPQPQGV